MIRPSGPPARVPLQAANYTDVVRCDLDVASDLVPAPSVASGDRSSPSIWRVCGRPVRTVRTGPSQYGCRVRLTIAAIILAVVLTAGCSDDDDRAMAPTTSEQTTTSQPQSSDLADCQRRTRDSSPALFDPSGGTYAAQSVTTVEGRKVQFDVVQWLSGEDANEAYLRESGDDSGAPNDYYILNERAELRTAQVSGSAVILVLRADGHAGSLHEVPFESIPTDEPHRTFWLTFTDGAITEVCQQYRP